MSAANVQLARRGYTAMLAGDLDAVAELLAPRVKWHGGDPDADGACRDRGQALSFMRQARARGPIGELVDVIDAGDPPQAANGVVTYPLWGVPRYGKASM